MSHIFMRPQDIPAQFILPCRNSIAVTGRGGKYRELIRRQRDSQATTIFPALRSILNPEVGDLFALSSEK